VSEGEKLLAPLKAFGSPVGDGVTRRTYASQQRLLDATQPNGRRYYWKSEYLPGVTPDALATLRRHAARAVSPHSSILIFPIDGPLNALPGDHSAVGNRDAKAVFNIQGSWERPEDDAANIEWARSAWRDIRRLSTGGTYVNFLTEEETGERIRAAYGAGYARLVDVKTAWDPGNLFAANKNVAPREA
jgi:FAD/FMN-containing dehydrogenase